MRVERSDLKLAGSERAHGIHGRHGSETESEKLPANGANEREWGRGKDRRRSFFTTKHAKDTKVGGWEPEKLPADYAEGWEWGKEGARSGCGVA